jgi:hypothetical protein
LSKTVSENWKTNQHFYQSSDLQKKNDTEIKLNSVSEFIFQPKNEEMKNEISDFTSNENLAK